ncbi:MAG: phosphoenolpyruvate kinase [Acidobacteria bacterium]|nr:phosphoenolpyruvate kinase [Acidobacteriota bacterium]
MQPLTHRRQPIHTVYGGAHLFRADTASRLGVAALGTLREYGPDPETLAAATGMAREAAAAVYPRIVDTLQREPVEDFRLDFEDGYGHRPDSEEDGHAASAAREVANGLLQRTLPPFIGIRIKPLNDELRDRALRTTHRFLAALLEGTRGRLPDNFVVTLPKITAPSQVTALVRELAAIETERRLAPGSLRMELMVETPQSIFDEHGAAALPAFVRAGEGRIVAAHFGTYDYTASLGITAAYQHMRHPACDFARHVMQVALAGSGVWLSDGATNVLPVAVHPAGPHAPLTVAQQAENRAAVHRAWKRHYDDIRHSLTNGYYQGWDLHPAQLVTRYAAVYGFFFESLDAASERLRNFIAKAAQATLVGEVFDDAATGQGLLNFFLKALNCGAVGEDAIEAQSGLTLDELRSGSFLQIVQARTERGQSHLFANSDTRRGQNGDTHS